MQDNVYKDISKIYCPRFGKISVEMGFVTAKQLKDALTEQADDDIANKPHKLIGRIFYENGWITDKQIELILNELFTNKNNNTDTS